MHEDRATRCSEHSGVELVNSTGGDRVIQPCGFNYASVGSDLEVRKPGPRYPADLPRDCLNSYEGVLHNAPGIGSGTINFPYHYEESCMFFHRSWSSDVSVK